MSASTVISTVDNITLVTLQDFPANVASISKVFEAISQCGINIDMISMAPTHGATTGLSFTISDEDLIGILGFTSKLKQETDMDVIVSSVNHKISVYDPVMKNTPGIAAQVRVQLSNGQARCLQLQSHRPAHGNEYIRSPNRYAEQDP